MTYEEMRQVALRKGFVRWTKSHRIERLRIGARDGAILAMRPLTKREHPILRHEAHYLCTEVKPTEFVPVGEIFW